MISVDEALGRIEAHVKPLSPRLISLGEALGFVLAEEVVSTVNSPPYDKAMMDGYAVISGDRDPQRHVVQDVMAGDVPHAAVTPGAAVRIMTGAPLPEGADAVIPLEQIERTGEHSIRLVDAQPTPGQHILRFGSCIHEGQVVLRKNHLLRAVDLGILAEIGRHHVRVCARPSVAVLPTGNELVNVADRPRVGQIRNSNGPMLTAAVQAVGGTAKALGIGRDDPAELARLIKQGLESDVLLISGGISAGDRDLVPGVLQELGVEKIFHKVTVKPGKPVWFGVAPKHDGIARQTLVFGLPGNPVSGFVCFQLFVRPALSALAGRGFVGMKRATAQLSHRHECKGGRTTYAPARFYDDEVPAPAEGTSASRLPRVELLPWKGSADLATFAEANALVELPAEGGTLPAGSRVNVHLP